MSVEQVQYQTRVDVRETLEGEDLATPTVTRNAFNTTKTLNADSTPAVSAYIGGVFTVTGSATMNLASLSGGLLAAQNLTGLKVIVAKFKAKETNGSRVNIQDGASNGYGLMGASFSVTLSPGQEIAFYGDQDTPTIASGARTLDFANVGTGSDENEIEFSIAAGA